MKNPLRTLRGRLATTYACLALLGVATSALYTANTVRSGLHDRVVLDLADEARLLAHDVSGPLARGDLAAVDDYVARAETLTHARLLVVDRAGELVAVTRGASAPLDEDNSLAAALSGGTIVLSEARGGADVVHVSVPIALDDGSVVGALEATYPLDEVQAILSRLNLTSLLLAVGAVVAAALAGSLLATSVARPAGQVAQAALALANRRAVGLPFGPESDSAFPPPLPEPRGSTDEIRALVQAFNSLADQLRVHEQARREFASDVSHELHSLASAMQTAAEALEREVGEVGADRWLDVGRLQGDKAEIATENSGAGMNPWSAVRTTTYLSLPTFSSRYLKKSCSARSSRSVWSCERRDSALYAWFT